MGKWYQGKTVKKYLLSYILISITPIIVIGIIYYHNSYIYLKQQTANSMQVRLEQLKSDIDYRLKDMESISVHFSANLDLFDKYLENGINGISQQLFSYTERFPKVDEIIYYPRGYPIVFTTKECVNYRKFQDSNDFGRELDMINFFSRLNTATRSYFLPSQKMHPYNEGNGSYLIYLQPIPYLSSFSKGTVAFIFKKSSIIELVKNYFGEDFRGYLFIFDSMLGTSFRLDTLLNQDFNLVESSLTKVKGIGLSEIAIQGDRYVTMRVVSQNLGYTYIIAMPYKNFYQNVRSQVNVFTGILIALIATVLMISVFLTIKNYAPIKKLAEDLFATNESEDTNDDVFEKISNRYRSIMTKNSELLIQINNQRLLAWEQLLENILTGKLADRDKLESLLKRANISFDERSFFAMAIRLNDNLKYSDLAMQTVSEIYCKYGKTYSLQVKYRNTLAVIANVTTGEGESDSIIRREIAEMFKNLLEKNGFSDSIIGVGGMYGKLLELDISYFEALSTIENASGGIHLFIRDETADKSNRPTAYLSMYQQALFHDNEEVALSVLNRMLDNLKDDTASFSVRRCFYFYLVNILMDVTSSLGIELPENEIAKVATNSDLPEFTEMINRTTKYVCEQVRLQNEKNTEKLTNDIIEYVNEHFSDYGITVDTLAEKFNFSPSYIRKLFKEKTDCNFLQYITTLRFNYIKQQLLQTNLPIHDIVNRAGYIDLASFIRKFKAVEGITPSQYRKMFQNIKRR